MRLAALLSLFALCGVSEAKTRGHDNAALVRRNSTGLTDAVTWDPHSLSIFGQRVFILSGEVHPWRQPNPDLWADVFQKLADSGFNTVCFIVDWALHYPTPDAGGGEGDWQEGTYRDLQRFIDAAKDAGLWLIARPGPYINAETSGGGLPGWVGNIAGSLRTDNANYTAAWTPYLTSVAKILAANQITEGGPIILVQAENEFSAGTHNSPYMQAVIDTLRAAGIVVPITTNDQHAGAAGNFSPDKGGEGAVNIYCGDTYPQGTSRWAQVQSVYYLNHVAVAPSNPLCLAEFGGGWLQGWGAGGRGGTGYEFFETQTTNAQYEDVFYKDAYAQTATIFNVYMIFGGTNWGQTAEPTVYTSYDYGAGINENRVLTQKMPEMRMQGFFLRVSRDLLGATLISNGTNYTTSSAVHTAELRNLETGAAFYVLRQNDTTSTSLSTTKLNITTSAGDLQVPVNASITLNGRDSKFLVADYVFGASNVSILYSTIEIMTWTTIDDRDYLVLYAPAGEVGETALKYSYRPHVSTAEAPNVTSTFADGLLTLSYDNIAGAQYVDVDDGLTVVVLDKTMAYGWHAPIISTDSTFGNYFSIGSNDTVLVSGPYVVRNASIDDDTLVLNGDLNGTTAIEFIAPSSISKLIWNGASRLITSTSHRSFVATVSGATSVDLPVIGTWKVAGSLPEADPTFDDSGFVTADLTMTNYTNLPPLAGPQVLYSQQYDFYGGNLIFRGHFNASGEETGFNLIVIGGFGFGYSAFFNDVFLGSNQGNATVFQTTDVWEIPDGVLKVGEDNVLTVIQDHMGLVETSSNSGKEPRGIRGYAILGANTTFSTWKIQGNQGGSASAPDTFRGYLNEGGLYAERIGAHLPGFDDSDWSEGSPLAVDGGGTKGAGVNFYRTTFDWNAPLDVDIPLRLNITASSITENYRVQIYLNGWQLGKYINNLGPQTAFVLPPGILRRQRTNTLALSLWSLDDTPVGLAGLSFFSDETFATAMHMADYTLPPDYSASGRPTPSAVSPM